MDIGKTALLMDAENSVAYAGAERRLKPRIVEPFRATVHGVGANGQAFMAETVLDNISANGLYLRLRQPVVVGAELVIVSKLAMASNGAASGPLVAMCGTVIRAQFTPDDLCGVAVEINSKQFL